jgi:histone H3/H4
MQKDIRERQEDPNCIIPRASFARVVHEILADNHPAEISIRATAIEALRVAGEEQLTEIFAAAQDLTAYQAKSTVTYGDFRFAMAQQGIGRNEEELSPPDAEMSQDVL